MPLAAPEIPPVPLAEAAQPHLLAFVVTQHTPDPPPTLGTQDTPTEPALPVAAAPMLPPPITPYTVTHHPRQLATLSTTDPQPYEAPLANAAEGSEAITGDDIAQVETAIIPVLSNAHGKQDRQPSS